MAQVSPPVYSTEVPSITADAGNPVAYQKPNSPESIARKMAGVQAQATEDTRYDVAMEKRPEPFVNGANPMSMLQIVLFLFILFLLFALFVQKTLNKYARGYIVTLALLLLASSIALNKNGD
jgi:hypothetical protein